MKSVISVFLGIAIGIWVGENTGMQPIEPPQEVIEVPELSGEMIDEDLYYMQESAEMSLLEGGETMVVLEEV